MKIDIYKYGANVVHPFFSDWGSKAILWVDESLIQSVIIESVHNRIGGKLFTSYLTIILQENTFIKLNFEREEAMESFIKNEMTDFCNIYDN